MSWITDISHFSGVLDPASTAPAPAKNMARFLGSIVHAASAWIPDLLLESAIPCRRRPKRRVCSGRIRLVLVEHDENDKPSNDVRIVWECPACGDNGVIRNWQGSEWDMADVGRDDGFWDQKTDILPLTDQEWRTLLDELADDRSLLAVLIVAQGSEHGPQVEIAEAEMKLLLEGVFQAMKRAYGVRKRLLNSVMGKLHVVLHEPGVVH